MTHNCSVLILQDDTKITITDTKMPFVGGGGGVGLCSELGNEKNGNDGPNVL